MKQLFLVSAGPGDEQLLVPAAKQAINICSDLVGYRFYLELLAGLCQGKKLHDSALGQETERARMALNLAADGKTTALISSGDIGIYAMATLVFELLDKQLQAKENHPEWLEIDTQVIPGISAMQIGSSRVGALLGHDFCTISLSDLLTPWEIIEKRIHSAGIGDFVISFYNPVSKKRDWQLQSAKDILLNYRSADTPVLLARQLSRKDESIKIIKLADLEASQVDMFSLVSVGNTESRHIINGQREWIYTPRGYNQKTFNLDEQG